MTLENKDTIRIVVNLRDREIPKKPTVSRWGDKLRLGSSNSTRNAPLGSLHRV